jgi:hypothetical protein
VVSAALARLEGWEELPAAVPCHWNLLWSWSRPKLAFTSLLAWQRINHYPGSEQLTHKDMLVCLASQPRLSSR